MKGTILVLSIAVACSPNPKPAQPDHVRDDGVPAAHAEAGAQVVAADAPAGADQEVLDALHALESEHPSDVPPAAWWKAHAAQVRPYLRAMLDDGSDDGMADHWAMRILGDLGDPADVDVLAKVLTWKTDTARMDAASALGVHPAVAAGEALIAATKGANVDTVGYAASALGSRKTEPAARTRLEELLDHAESTVRYRAVNALAELGGSKDALARRKKIEKDAEVRAALVKALKAP